MEADFPRSLRLVLVDEGGLDDDPQDHGGRTAHGVTQREYDAYRRRKGLPVQDVWKITPAEVSDIYHSCYWLPVCGELPAGLDYLHLDDRINAGPVQAVRTLQRALSVSVDGHIGEITLEAIAHADDLDLIKRYANERRKFYRRLRQFPRYGKGWLARVNHCEHGANEIAATGDTVRQPLPDHLKKLATARANPADIKPPFAKKAATHTFAGAVSAMVAFFAQGVAQEQKTIPIRPAPLVAPTVVGWPPPFPKPKPVHPHVIKPVVPWTSKQPAL